MTLILQVQCSLSTTRSRMENARGPGCDLEELFPRAGQCPARVDPVPGPTTLPSFTPMGRNCQSPMCSAPSHRPTSCSLFLLCTLYVHHSFMWSKALQREHREDMSVNPVTAIDIVVVGFCSKKAQPRKGELGTTFLAKFLPHLVP